MSSPYWSPEDPHLRFTHGDLADIHTWPSRDSEMQCLTRIEAKLDELLELEKKRKGKEDYASLTDAFKKENPNVFRRS